MNLAGSDERSNERDMTAVTIRGDRSLNRVGSEGMNMTMGIEITSMTCLTVFTTGRSDSTALEGTVSGVMTSETS